MRNLLILTAALALIFAPSVAQAANNKILVTYFSASGRTKAVARQIAKETGGTLFEIAPKQRYSNADLNYNDSNSRCVKEHNNPKARPEIANKVANLAQYDTIFVGYPIWWGEAPNIILTFLETNNLSGKTIVPFCTSYSSPLGQSDVNLHKFAPKAKWQKGCCFKVSSNSGDVSNWLKTLKK